MEESRIHVSSFTEKSDLNILNEIIIFNPGSVCGGCLIKNILPYFNEKRFNLLESVEKLMNKYLTIVTEGGRAFGFGHITRCKAIADCFQRYGFLTKFVINGDASIYSVLEESRVIMYDWIKHKDRLLDNLHSSSIILIDSIEITNKQIAEIQSVGVPIIFIDDEKRRNFLEAGFVVDWTVLSDNKDYFVPRKNKVTYLLGSQYTPLREEYNTAKKNKIKDNIQSIMITFGGSDVRNLTPFFLKNLNKLLPNCKKNIIIGSGFYNLQQIEKFKDKNTNLIFEVTASKMVEVMQGSDLAIASGGQTLYELAKIGTPAIVVLIAENAKSDTFGWAEVGSISYIGWWDDEKLLRNLEIKLSLLKSKKKRKEMQDYAKEYINPNGANLLVNSIIKAL